MIPSYYDPPDQLEGSRPMRGDDPRHEAMFSYVTPEARVRADHPLRPIRRMTDAALARLSPRFERLYSTMGRPSIPPEQLLRALLLQMLYSIRSERLLVEELDYSVLYRWFVGLSLDDPIWDATTFTKNRDRLLEGDIAEAFFAEVVAAIKADGLMSDEHFTVDGTLLEAWASQKSFTPKGSDRTPPDDPKNPSVNFHGQTRRNDTHESTTDPDARLYKKGGGHEAKLAYLGHLLTENRHGLIVDTAVTAATGTAERDAAIVMLGELPLDDPSRHRRRRQVVRHARVGRRGPPNAHHPACRRGSPSSRRECHRRAHGPPRRLCSSANASGSWSSKPLAG